MAKVPGRKIELFIHLSEAAITAGGTLTPEGAVGRVDNTRNPICAEQIREWLGVADSSILIRPVIDLKDHVPVGSHEIPDRLKQQVRLRDQHCMHPYCTHKAEACDLDHATPHHQGGTTCPCNLVPLCRRHHRNKTFSQWRYLIIEPGSCLWITPSGRHFLVDHHGTHALDPPRRIGHSDPPLYTGEPCPEAKRLAPATANTARNRRRVGQQLHLFHPDSADPAD